MGRFFNREALISALILILFSIGIAIASEQNIWIKIAIGAGIPILLHWPIAIWFQEKMLNFYVESCRYDSALRLALQIRDATLDRRSRQDATRNLAFVQIAQGNYEAALRNLKTIIVPKDRPGTHAVIDGVTGYCLAYQGNDLQRAEELISASIRAQPEEGIFVTFLALLRLRQGKFDEAKALLDKSWELEPDPDQPHPGERAYLSALISFGRGETGKAKEMLEEASQANERSRFAILAKEAIDKGNLKDLLASMVVEPQPAAPESAPKAESADEAKDTAPAADSGTAAPVAAPAETAPAAAQPADSPAAAPAPAEKSETSA